MFSRSCSWSRPRERSCWVRWVWDWSAGSVSVAVCNLASPFLQGMSMLWAAARPPAAFLFLSGAGFLKLSINVQTGPPTRRLSGLVGLQLEALPHHLANFLAPGQVSHRHRLREGVAQRGALVGTGMYRDSTGVGRQLTQQRIGDPAADHIQLLG